MSQDGADSLAKVGVAGSNPVVRSRSEALLDRRRVRIMSGRRSRRGSWTDRRAEYNRWAGRHTWLIWAIVAALIAVLIILIAARLSHPLPPLPDVSSSPQTDQGRLS
jgi:hypothetical protein